MTDLAQITIERLRADAKRYWWLRCQRARFETVQNAALDMWTGNTSLTPSQCFDICVDNAMAADQTSDSSPAA